MNAAIRSGRPGEYVGTIVPPISPGRYPSGVNVKFAQQVLTIPYVSATILLDGADIGLMHLIQEVEADQVHMGMRVEAVWSPPEERGPTLESIRYFRPTGEPDAAYESYREYV